MPSTLRFRICHTCALPNATKERCNASYIGNFYLFYSIYYHYLSVYILQRASVNLWAYRWVRKARGDWLTSEARNALWLASITQHCVGGYRQHKIVFLLYVEILIDNTHTHTHKSLNLSNVHIGIELKTRLINFSNACYVYFDWCVVYNCYYGYYS